jgi:hypothetical protein
MKIKLDLDAEQLATVDWALRRIAWGRGIRRERRSVAEALLAKLHAAQAGHVHEDPATIMQFPEFGEEK